MITLSREQVIHLHKRLLQATGGLGGIRDEGLLDSALQNSFQTFEGTELYPSTAKKIARAAYTHLWMATSVLEHVLC
jgi:death-on-curing protein